MTKAKIFRRRQWVPTYHGYAMVWVVQMPDEHEVICLSFETAIGWLSTAIREWCYANDVLIDKQSNGFNAYTDLNYRFTSSSFWGAIRMLKDLAKR